MHGILCFGNSITFGKGEMPSVGWVGRLKDYFEQKDPHNGVYNLGISGNTSTDLLNRFDVECKARIKLKRPRDKFVILISIGTNDCKWDSVTPGNNPRTIKEIFKNNIKELIKKAKAYPADLAFIGLPPVDESKTIPFEETSFLNERVKSFNDIIKELCLQNDVLFLDMFTLMSKENHLTLLEDGLHPNSVGYEFMFKEIRRFIEINKFI